MSQQGQQVMDEWKGKRWEQTVWLEPVVEATGVQLIAWKRGRRENTLEKVPGRENKQQTCPWWWGESGPT